MGTQGETERVILKATKMQIKPVTPATTAEGMKKKITSH